MNFLFLSIIVILRIQNTLEYKLHLFENQTDALCLDGSPYGFYYELGLTDHFILWFEGGGECDGTT